MNKTLKKLLMSFLFVAGCFSGVFAAADGEDAENHPHVLHRIKRRGHGNIDYAEVEKLHKMMVEGKKIIDQKNKKIDELERRKRAQDDDDLDDEVLDGSGRRYPRRPPMDLVLNKMNRAIMGKTKDDSFWWLAGKATVATAANSVTTAFGSTITEKSKPLLGKAWDLFANGLDSLVHFGATPITSKDIIRLGKTVDNLKAIFEKVAGSATELIAKRVGSSINDLSGNSEIGSENMGQAVQEQAQNEWLEYQSLLVSRWRNFVSELVEHKKYYSRNSSTAKCIDDIIMIIRGDPGTKLQSADANLGLIGHLQAAKSLAAVRDQQLGVLMDFFAVNLKGLLEELNYHISDNSKQSSVSGSSSYGSSSGYYGGSSDDYSY